MKTFFLRYIETLKLFNAEQMAQLGAIVIFVDRAYKVVKRRVRPEDCKSLLLFDSDPGFTPCHLLFPQCSLPSSEPGSQLAQEHPGHDLFFMCEMLLVFIVAICISVPRSVCLVNFSDPRNCFC